MTDDTPSVKNVQVRDEDRVETVWNALDAAREQASAETDAEALVELARAYTGWSA